MATKQANNQTLTVISNTEQLNGELSLSLATTENVVPIIGANWCGPCRELFQFIESNIDSTTLTSGLVKFIKYNISDQEDIDDLNTFLYSQKRITEPIEKIPTTIYYGKSTAEEKYNRVCGFDREVIRKLIYKDCKVAIHKYTPDDMF